MTKLPFRNATIELLEDYYLQSISYEKVIQFIFRFILFSFDKVIHRLCRSKGFLTINN